MMLEEAKGSAFGHADEYVKPRALCFFIPCCRAVASCKGLMPCTVCCHWQTGRWEMSMKHWDFLTQTLPQWRKLHCPKLVLFDGCHGANSCITKVGTLERGARKASGMMKALGNGSSEKSLILLSQCRLSFFKKGYVSACLSSRYFSGWMGTLGKWSEVAQSCPTLCDPMDCSLPGSSVHRVFQARVLEWGAVSFLQGIFPTQGLNPGLPHCRVKQTLYLLSHQQSQMCHWSPCFGGWGWARIPLPSPGIEPRSPAL